MKELILRLKSGVSLAVPASLDSITTYVFLEQEEWFEKEPEFLRRWLRPGMTVVDIGANLGVYSLAAARCVGPHGHVFAYEPASEPRGLLERSRDINRADNLHVIAAAASDSEREGRLVLGASSELNTLEGSGPSESIHITSLDAEDRARGWSAVDFVKIDAEGEEERILEGGSTFFDRHSPLVMFEIKAGDSVNETLRSAFVQRGYGVYRLVPGGPVLVPDEPGTPLDPFELNLFAAKPDRAAALASDGWLIDSLPNWAPRAADRDRAIEMLIGQPYAPAFARVFAHSAEMDSDYRDALAGYAAWRSPDLPMAERCGALNFACGTLFAVCRNAPTLARLSSLARASWDAGQRLVCTIALKSFAELFAAGEMNLSEPFWPACARMDGLFPGEKSAQWLLVSAFEQFERASRYSSQFGAPVFDLDWLCTQPFVAAEMERRRILMRVQAGERAEVPARLCVAADDHLNADVWRAGLVPGTFVRQAAQTG
jgi:FkbM family methyltransferase